MRYAKKGAVITDVGSTKTWIVGKVENALARFPSLFFVGSHPMAGSEHAGVEYAKSDLLKDAPCIVTKTLKTNNSALRKVAEFWSSLGAKVKVMDPLEHDRAVSMISHLPHLVAFSLAGAISEKDFVYAAEGFKDTTRVASSDPKLWADILLSNRLQILKSARTFWKYYRDIIKNLSKNDYAGTVRLLKKAKSKRDKFVYGKDA